jgi:hypothetical protein
MHTTDGPEQKEVRVKNRQPTHVVKVPRSGAYGSTAKIGIPRFVMRQPHDS